MEAKKDAVETEKEVGVKARNPQGVVRLSYGSVVSRDTEKEQKMNNPIYTGAALVAAEKALKEMLVGAPATKEEHDAFIVGFTEGWGKRPGADRAYAEEQVKRQPNAVAEWRIRQEAEGYLSAYLRGDIRFETLMTRLQQIDDSKHYEMAAAEEEGEDPEGYDPTRLAAGDGSANNYFVNRSI